MNKIILSGRLATDVTFSELPNERKTKKAQFTLAVDRTSGTAPQKSDFFQCEVFNTLAETVAEYLHKGNKIIIEGTMNIDVVESMSNMGKIYKTYPKVRGNNIEFIDSKRKDDDENE